MAAADGCALSVPGLKDALSLNRRAPPPNVSVKKSDVHVGNNIYCQGTVNMYVDTSSPDIIKNITNRKPVTVKEGWRGWLEGLTRKQKAIYLTAISIVGVLLLFVCIYFPLVQHVPKTDEDICPVKLKTFCRNDWFATDPAKDIPALKGPVPYVIIGSSQDCFTSTSCKNIVKNLQHNGIDRGEGDIAYNFLIGGDGALYIGRGWDFQSVTAHGYFNNSIGVVFIGYYLTDTPTECQMRVYSMLIEEGICLRKIAPNYVVHHQREIIGSDSPGNALIKEIVTWPHYRPISCDGQVNLDSCDNATTESSTPGTQLNVSTCDVPVPCQIPSNERCASYPDPITTTKLSGYSSCPNQN